MQLVWNLHPKQINVQQARSAAYQYRLQEWNDGRAELTVQHRGDRPSETPIKRFVYKNRNGAFGGAQRFEDQHGYREEEIDRINRLCAMAWDEGYALGVDDERTSNDNIGIAGMGMKVTPARENPYRKTETTED
jgi:hypothetical protein